MPDITTARVGFVKMETGAHDNSWGDLTNQNWSRAEAKMTSYHSISVAGGTLALDEDQRRKAIILFTGLLAANQIIEMASADADAQTIEDTWIVINETTGDFSLTVKTPAGSGVVVPQGAARRLYNTSIDIKEAALTQGALMWCGTAGGNANVITLTLPFTGAAYVDGMELAFRAKLTNTAAVTIALTPVGGSAFNAKQIIDRDGNDLRAGAIQQDAIYRVLFNATRNAFELIGGNVNFPTMLTAVAKSANFTIGDGDLGKIFLVDASVAAVSAALVSAVTLRAGFWCSIVKIDSTANAVTIDPAGAQLINDSATFVLDGHGAAAMIISDGAGWRVWGDGGRVEISDLDDAATAITYTSPITPDFASGGNARRIVLAGNTTINAPTNVRPGQIITFELVQDGTGNRQVTWNSAYKLDGNFTLSALANATDIVLGRVISPTDIEIWIAKRGGQRRYGPPDVLIEHQELAGTDGGTATAGSWEKRTLNTLVHNVDTMCSLASNQFTLPAGEYCIQFEATGYNCGLLQAKLYDATNITTRKVGRSITTGTVSLVSTGMAFVTITAPAAYELQAYVGTTKATSGCGLAINHSTIPEENEVYERVLVWKTK